MKIVFILFTFLLFTGCASLGENLAGHSYNDIKKMDLEGKDPVEVKKMLGVPVFEGFHEGKGGQEVHNGIGFSYSLVYSTK
ncbi:MAG: hypothetical protein NXH75_14665, partial [Halobacteriovoraceae bacterium]|nr:hypothetical protein [Halobacteriovoraceae bacterium]